MKNSVLIFTLLLSLSLFGQDVIILEDRSEINSVVKEINEETIKYKEYDFQDGPLRSVSTSRVFMIIYENGKREKFNADFISPEQSQTNLEKNEAGPEKNETDSENNSKQFSRQLKNSKNYGAVGLGLGTSYGGSLGVKAQYAFGGKFKFGPHAALGFGSSTGITYSLGVSFYLNNLYLDLIYGPVVYKDYGTNGGGYDEAYYGPSAIIGYDWYFSDHFGLNVGIGASYWEGDSYYFDEDTFFAFDFGFKYRFK